MQKSRNMLLRLMILALIASLSLPALALAKTKQPEPTPAPVKITLMATGRVNGHIIDWDYKFPRTAEFGLAKISTLVKEQRQRNSYNILLDTGNMFSGSALTDCFATIPSKLPNPMVAMYNSLGYDAVVLGQGELVYGTDYLTKAMEKANFSLLSANVHTPDKILPTLKPYIIKEINVSKDKKKDIIRIGIIGTSTINPTAPETTQLKLTDPTAATDALIKKIGNTVDALIIVKNEGLQIEGINAITRAKINIAAAPPGKFGSSLSKTELTFEKIGKKWFLYQGETAHIYAVTAQADKTMSDAAWPYHDAALQHLKAVEDQKAAQNQQKPAEQPQVAK